MDKGCRGVEIEGVRILRSRQRRSAIKPAIGYMKMDGRLGRNSLKGALGAARGDVRRRAQPAPFLAALRLLCARFGLSTQAVIAALITAPVRRRPACG